MKKLILIHVSILITGLLTWSAMNGQNTITFTFTGISNSDYLQLESIKVKNLTQDCDTVLYYPDTVLTIYNVGITEDDGSLDGFRVMQNYPNPSADATSVRLYVPREGLVNMSITDAAGRRLLESGRMLDRGLHSLRLTLPGEGIYLFNACWNNIISSTRIVSIYDGPPQRSGSIDYSGGIPVETNLKRMPSEMDFLFSPGDELMLIGYADTLESGFLDCPETSQDYVFQFAANIPCPGLDSLFYDGQWYHTTQAFSQCWIKENMNAGVMIPSGQSQANNDIIEKYCMGDVASYCSLLGGLYFWDEMMKYTNVTGGQGICPDGFHVPTDMEWQILEGAADSDYEIGAPVWKTNGWRGTDAGGNLKQTGFDFWEPPNTGATNALGFSVIAGGYFVQGGFWGPGYKAYIWSSNNVWMYYRNFDWNQAQVQRGTGGDEMAISVRCVRN
jgi:uncharacterized protein (TIGR02145 family)